MDRLMDGTEIDTETIGNAPPNGLQTTVAYSVPWPIQTGGLCQHFPCNSQWHRVCMSSC